MKKTSPLRNSLLLAAGLSLAAFQANAATVIQVDFGTAANTTGSGLSRDIGSYGAAKADGYTVGNFWNAINANTAGTLVVDDAGTATTVSLAISNATALINAQTISLATGEANAEITRDFLYRTSNTLTTTFTGLAANTYDVYVMIGSPNSADRSWNVGFSVGGTAVGSLAALGLQTAGAGDNTTWQAGTNYVTRRVTIGTGESLALTSVGTQANGTQYGVFNAIQIVAVPELSSALLGGLGTLLLLRRRRA